LKAETLARTVPVSSPSCPVGQRGAVEPGTQGDVPAAQRLPQLLTVHPRYPEGEYSGLLARVFAPEHLHPRELGERLPHLDGQGPLMAADGLYPLLFHEAQSLQQPGDPGDVVGPRLQTVGQEVRHLLPDGFTSRAPLQQRRRGLSAEQKTGPLGAVQPLVARHGDEGCPQFLQMDREAAR